MTSAHDPHHDDGHGDRSRFIQHHYDDAQHQFDSGKLGIWFFLVQEVLFFSALFVAYILFRNHRPEIFRYAHRYLDVKWGAINTCVLIISSLTAAWAVRCAQLGQRRGLIATLSITIVCACAFLGIKFIEYKHKFDEGILYGAKFDPCISPGGAELLTREDHCPGTKRSECRGDNIDQSTDPGWQVDCKVDEVRGRWEVVKGTDPATGKPTEQKNFVETNRANLPPCQMVRRGWGPPEAENAPCWEIAQNPWVCKSTEVAALVHYKDHYRRGKDFKIELSCKDGVSPPPLDLDKPLPESRRFGEAVVKVRPTLTEHQRDIEESMGPPPPHTNMFFSIYFAMTGLHGVHVLVGIGVFVWLLIRAIRGDFSPDYFGPVDYAALYWHLVDLIWIFLFPLLYLIH